MATNATSTSKDHDLGDDLLAEEAEGVSGFDEDTVLSPRVGRKDPGVRRKIEDMLERRRLREELGLYDEAYWEDF